MEEKDEEERKKATSLLSSSSYLLASSTSRSTSSTSGGGGGGGAGRQEEQETQGGADQQARIESKSRDFQSLTPTKSLKRRRDDEEEGYPAPALRRGGGAAAAAAGRTTRGEPAAPTSSRTGVRPAGQQTNAIRASGAGKKNPPSPIGSPPSGGSSGMVGKHESIRAPQQETTLQQVGQTTNLLQNPPPSMMIIPGNRHQHQEMLQYQTTRHNSSALSNDESASMIEQRGLLLGQLLGVSHHNRQVFDNNYYINPLLTMQNIIGRGTQQQQESQLSLLSRPSRSYTTTLPPLSAATSASTTATPLVSSFPSTNSIFADPSMVIPTALAPHLTSGFSGLRTLLQQQREALVRSDLSTQTNRVGMAHRQEDESLGLPTLTGTTQDLLHRRPAVGPSSGIPLDLPTPLAIPEDSETLSPHQFFLRQQIEAFRATRDDITTHKRGRNKPISIGQVGIRCRHCAGLPVKQRQKGSTYFPACLSGLYQAAQNMSTMHLQCGVCTEMPERVRQHFTYLISTKASSSTGAGRTYWESAATKLGLVNSKDDSGIRFIRDTLRTAQTP